MKKVIVGKKNGKSVLQIYSSIDSRNVSEQKILKKYPLIFRQKDLPMTQTCMCWGLDVGQGWHKLIDTLCASIQGYIDANAKHNPNIHQVEAVQVKEKFGGLRFYTNGEDEVIHGMIWFAEQLSNYICEDCGTMDNVTQSEGWITTLCEKCRKKRSEDKHNT